MSFFKRFGGWVDAKPSTAFLVVVGVLVGFWLIAATTLALTVGPPPTPCNCTCE